VASSGKTFMSSLNQFVEKLTGTLEGTCTHIRGQHKPLTCGKEDLESSRASESCLIEVKNRLYSLYVFQYILVKGYHLTCHCCYKI
jgi:hypothetical protein